MGSKKTAGKGKTQSAAKKTPTKEVKTKKDKDEREKTKKPLGFMPYVLILAAVLLLLMFTMDRTGYLGSVLTPGLMGLFGYGVYLIPLYLIVIANFWKSDRENNTFSGRYLLCALNFIFLLAVVHLHTSNIEQRSFNQEGGFLVEFYKNGITGVGSGAVGGVIGSGLEFLIGGILTYIVGYLIVAVTFIFMAGSTPVRILKAIIESFRKLAFARQERELEREHNKAAKADEIVKTKTKKESEKPEVVYLEPIAAPTYSVRESTAEKAAPTTTDDNTYKSIFEEADGDAPFLTEAEIEPENDPAEAETELPADVVTVTTACSFTPQANCGAVVETVDLENKPSAPVYVYPPLSLLSEGNSDFLRNSSQNIALTGQKLISVLRTYGVKASMVSTSRGPAVTRYEVLPDEGIRVSRIEGLADDIRMRLAASSVRIESNIPGKAAIGIEIPNETASIVKLRDLIDNDMFRSNPSKLFVCLGVDVGGNPVYFDIPDMPHLLIAGATGMGKSVCINSIIISLLYRAAPDEVKFILIDPKKIELSCYNGIPHLLVPVVNEPRTAAGSLNWAVNEMERRYTLMEQLGNARNLEEYNEMVEGDPERDRLPYIVIIIDELADLIMSAKDAVENSICRLAQKARAAGIHLIVGTQRPSTDVITGLIKANIPSRIAFTVSQSVDSRIILDENGAESLLGKGDMIYAPVKMMKKLRVQGAYVDGKTEVAAVCQFIKNASRVEYSEDVIKMIEDEAKLCGEKPGRRRADESGTISGEEKEDPLFMDAIGVAFEFETMSTSLLQRKLSVGYARAQKIIDMMEDRGYVGKFDPATKKRKINISRDEYDELRLNHSGEKADA